MRNTRFHFLRKCPILLIIVCALFSCSKEDDSIDTTADYRLLGISSVSINNCQIPLKSDGVLFDLTNYEEIVVTGLLDEPNKKQIEVDYTILTTNPEASTVQIKSKYPDVSISIEKKNNISIKSQIIKITRKGYSESVVYNLVFFHPNQVLQNK